MAEKSAKGERVPWYRSPVKREDLSALNRRSDVKGFLQTGGHLGLLAATGTAAYLSAGRLPWPVVVLLFYFHGMCWAFMINGFHELVHDSVFKTKSLNRYFLYAYSFLGWHNPVHFWASHTEHHKYTLHPPDDLEVVLPQKVTLVGFLSGAFVNPIGLYQTLKATIRLSLGKLQGDWEHHLFDDNPQMRRRLFNGSRLILLGHVAIIAVSCVYGLWLLPVVISLASFYGGGVQYLCNNTQHAGLRDNVPDFRLCCRTIYLNPFVQFLYWHMNYHTEHHMYAAVPCYNLGKLHRLIKDDLPPCPRGLGQTWKQIVTILKRQKLESDYQYTAELPTGPRPARTDAAAEAAKDQTIIAAQT